MSRRGKKNVTPAINVTPLIDVVLVLLIVFMVITPMLKKTFYIELPKQEEKKVKEEQPQDGEPPVVLSLRKDGMGELNGDEIEIDKLVEKLRRVYAARDDHTLFFDAEDGAPYGRAVSYLDKAREAGAVHIAILTERPKGSAGELDE